MRLVAITDNHQLKKGMVIEGASISVIAKEPSDFEFLMARGNPVSIDNRNRDRLWLVPFERPDSEPRLIKCTGLDGCKVYEP